MDVGECQGCRKRDARIAALEGEVALLRPLAAEVARLKKLVADLAAKLQDKDLPKSAPQLDGQDSDAPTKPAKKTPRRKPGGQPGHPPHMKRLLPPDRVSKTVPIIPETCRRCGENLPQEAGEEDPPPTRFQVAELPDVKANITEYQGHARSCPCCGEVTQATIPQATRAHSIGPALAAFMAYLVGNCSLSKRRVEELVEEVLEVPVSLGTISRLEREMSEALASPHEEALAAVREAPVIHADETGWKKAGHKRWLWVVATGQMVVFVIHRLRSAAVIMQLLQGKVQGVLCSDRCKAYDWIPLLQRQLCWSHLKRNFEKLAARGGAARRIGDALLAIQSRVFELWHRFRGEELTRRQLGDEIASLILEMLEVLQRGERCRDAHTVRFCGNLSAKFVALWTFVTTEGVDPTNNHAERVQRLAVLYRKNCFGCHSNAGCRFVERLLTVVQTLRLQKRSVLTFLTAAIQAHRENAPAPKLAPAAA